KNQVGFSSSAAGGIGNFKLQVERTWQGISVGSGREIGTVNVRRSVAPINGILGVDSLGCRDIFYGQVEISRTERVSTVHEIIDGILQSCIGWAHYVYRNR